MKPAVSPCRRRPNRPGGDSEKRPGTFARMTPTTNSTKLRKRAKGARYTAELIAPLLGRRAARGASEFIRLATKVQDALGEHQDALITIGELEAHWKSSRIIPLWSSSPRTCARASENAPGLPVRSILQDLVRS